MGNATMAVSAQDALRDAEIEILTALERLQIFLPAGTRIEVAVGWVSSQALCEPPTYHPRVSVSAVLQSGRTP